MSEKIICIIPARGGSKRLPGKNIIEFRGKPIIAYTIQAALETELFSRVLVSTEDSEIAEISRSYGAEVEIRSKELATDDAIVIDVCLDLLKSERSDGREYEILCCLYATVPLRNSKDIKKTVGLVSGGQCKYAMAVTEFYYPVHQALKLIDADNLVPIWPDLINKRNSDLPKLFVDNGSTYAVRISEFFNNRTFYGKPLKGHIMSRERSVDIDVESDLSLAKFYASRMKI